MEAIRKMIEQGVRVVVRCTNAGVFFGTLAGYENGQAELKDVRRLWYWKGAASLSQLATEGVKKPSDCKFTVTVPVMVVSEVIEIIPATAEACLSIDSVKVWRI